MLIEHQELTDFIILSLKKKSIITSISEIKKRDGLKTILGIKGFPGNSEGKASACNAGDLGSIPGLERCPGEGNGYPLQYPGLENSMDCIVDGVAKNRIRLSDFHFH